MSFKIEVFLEQLLYKLSSEREEAAVSVGGIYFTPFLLLFVSFLFSSAHRKTGAGSFCVHVFQCICVVADVPCSVAHLLNVNVHSLFPLITPTPHHFSQSSLHHTPNYTPPSPTPLPQVSPNVTVGC